MRAQVIGRASCHDHAKIRCGAEFVVVRAAQIGESERPKTGLAEPDDPLTVPV